MRHFILFFLFLTSLRVSAEPLRVDFEKEISKSAAKNLFDLDPKTKESQLNILSRMKYFEIKKRWKECASLGAKVAAAHPEIQGWVVSSWLRCELKNAEAAKSNKGLEKVFKWLRQHKALLVDGPWQKNLWEDYISASIRALEDQRNEARINELLEYDEKLNKDVRAQLLAYSGELAENKKDKKKAFYFYEQSLQQKEARAVRDKYDSIKDALGLKFEVKNTTNEGAIDREGEEVVLEEKINKAIKSNDFLGALKASVIIQTEYVGSRTARRLKDRPFEIYLDILENTSTEAKHEKAFQELEKVGALRLADWAQVLHRRANYEQALIFSESALAELHQTSQATVLYWISGRSAHFMGQYDRALANFNKLIEFHSGSDEHIEALLRAGLIHLRLKNFAAAKTQFEKLIAQKKDRYDLPGRYWLVRTLENTDKGAAAVEAKALIEKYPFSYYGLRLSAESASGDYQWPQHTSKSQTILNSVWLTGSQATAWSRFKVLAKAGWLLEAQAEVQQFPSVRSPGLEYLFAKYLALNFQYPQAVRFMAEAMETDSSLRTPENLSLVFPKSYSSMIEAESKKYNLNPILIRSLIRQESAFGIRAQSTSNAQGLMQLIPPTAQDVARRLSLKKLEISEDVYRPEVNIPLGTFYISQMLEQFSGNVPFALGAYNAGPTKMRIFIEARDEIKNLQSSPSSNPIDEIWFDELPWSETSFYIKAILRNSLLYKLIDAAKIDWTLVLWQDLHSKKANLK